MAGHTPGPWTVYKGHDGQFSSEPYIIARQRHGAPTEVIAKLLRPALGAESQQVQEANACLTAAGPKMLTVLELIVEEAEEIYTEETGGGYILSPEAIGEAKAIIAKARGQEAQP